MIPPLKRLEFSRPGGTVCNFYLGYLKSDENCSFLCKPEDANFAEREICRNFQLNWSQGSSGPGRHGSRRSLFGRTHSERGPFEKFGYDNKGFDKPGRYTRTIRALKALLVFRGRDSRGHSRRILPAPGLLPYSYYPFQIPFLRFSLFSGCSLDYHFTV